MRRLNRFLLLHSRAVRITATVFLILTSVLCYVLLLILYVWPGSYGLSSFTTPSSSALKPTIAVQVVGALLGTCTVALVTRCVEQYLWLKLAPGDEKQQYLTVAESRRLAQWSGSPVERFFYVFEGRSWLLKLGGIMLLGITSVVPVLLWGISQTQSTVSNTEFQAHELTPWDGWLSVADAGYYGGQFSDANGIIAALATLSGLGAPPAPICQTPNCTVQATSTSMQVDCSSNGGVFPVKNFYTGDGTGVSRQYCSSRNPQICTEITSGGGCTYVNFTSGFAPSCSADGPACAGDFAVVFGAFVNNSDALSGPYYINTVDCLVRYGTAEISQVNQNPPTLAADSFKKSNNASVIPWDLFWLHRIYTDSAQRCPYTFTASSCAGDTSDSLWQSPVASLLLGYKANTSAEQVATQLENIFDMATLLAFSRASNASDMYITTSTQSSVWKYDERVLAILLVPLVATILGTWRRWKIAGRDMCPGYDPVEIARRGPIDMGPQRDHETEEADDLIVVGYQETIDGSSTPKGGMRSRLMVTQL